MAGFIPVDQFYSKLCGQKHKTELMNRKVAECLRDGHAIAIIYQITGFAYKRDWFIWGLPTAISRIKQIYHTRKQSRLAGHLPGILFTAKPAENDLYAIYVQKDDTGTCSLFPQLNKPLTADGDLM